MSSVTIQNVTKSFGNTVVLEKLRRGFPERRIRHPAGPVGLRQNHDCFASSPALEKPTSGCVKFDERVVSSEKVFIPPEKRDIGMVFQSYACGRT